MSTGRECEGVYWYGGGWCLQVGRGMVSTGREGDGVYR